jgi:hypothetical protein
MRIGISGETWKQFMRNLPTPETSYCALANMGSVRTYDPVVAIRVATLPATRRSQVMTTRWSLFSIERLGLL